MKTAARTAARTAAATALALIAAGCSTLDFPAQGETRADREQRMTMSVMSLRQENRQVRTELASLRSDLQILEETQRRLLALQQDYQQASAEQTRQIQELSSLVASMQVQLESADDVWQRRMAKLQQELTAESQRRQTAINEMTSVVGKEMERVADQVKKARTPPAARTYTVSSGDTLSTIAQAFGVAIGDIKALNGLTSDLIRVGQVLRIP